jgi:hypothetical protein
MVVQRVLAGASHRENDDGRLPRGAHDTPRQSYTSLRFCLDQRCWALLHSLHVVIVPLSGSEGSTSRIEAVTEAPSLLRTGQIRRDPPPSLLSSCLHRICDAGCVVAAGPCQPGTTTQSRRAKKKRGLCRRPLHDAARAQSKPMENRVLAKQSPHPTGCFLLSSCPYLASPMPYICEYVAGRWRRGPVTFCSGC